MSYYVYILSTKRNNKLITYTGYTKDLKNRLLLHNTGKGAKFTRGSVWKLVFKKRFKLKNKALKFENLLKKKLTLDIV